MTDYPELETLDVVMSGNLVKLLKLTDKFFEIFHTREGIPLAQKVFKLEDEYIKIKKNLGVKSHESQIQDH